MFLEKTNVRYTFVRYGVPYVWRFEMLDGESTVGKVVRDADKVAVSIP